MGKKAISIIGVMIAILVLACISFAVVSTVKETQSPNRIINKPNIGKVRKLVSPDGNETKFFVPIIENKTIRNRGKIKKIFNWLKGESDPDVKRQYLFELSNASTEEAKEIIDELILMLKKEPDENVRITYISCLSSLVQNTEIDDGEILRILDALKTIMREDPSWNVKSHTANILSWYGVDEVINVLQEVIDKNIDVIPNVLESIPAALERINNSTAETLLIRLRSK